MDFSKEYFWDMNLSWSGKFLLEILVGYVLRSWWQSRKEKIHCNGQHRLKGILVIEEEINWITILTWSNFNNCFQFNCDANGMTIGFLLSQDDKTIPYHSEKLNEAKQKYSYYDKKFYVMVQALKRRGNYLLPKEFI